MSEMVERVARAVWADLERQAQQDPALAADRFVSNPAYGEVYGIVDIRGLVIAAIRAMREPTEGMMMAGVHTFRDDGPVVYISGLPTWQAMIDAALPQGTPNDR